MNKRELSKKNTITKILNAAKIEFVKSGFLKTKTIDIAERAGVAHGTLFLYFNNKETLIIEIFRQEIKKIALKMHESLKNTLTIKEMLGNYLQLLISEEDFFCVIAREFPFYPDTLKREIMVLETATRKYFYESIQIGIANNMLKPMNITSVLIFLFGTIDYILKNKTIFTNKSSVIEEKKAMIINTFINFIT